MTRTALLLALVPFALVACKEDPSGPMTSASQPTGATDPDTTDGSGGETVGLTATGAAASNSGTGTDTGDITDGTTGGQASATNATSATSPTGATTDPTADPTNGPDPTETAFITPMTDEGGSDPTLTTNSSDPSGGDPTYGQCGWSAQNNFYDCADAGGSPGAADPQGIDPIACADGLQEGADCNEQTGPVKNVGCCAPGGTLYYCTSQGNFIVKQECGA
ncbi:MAG: hypothetical protein JNL82_19365 [Myxococcales bacterium]|nr:hypothetical protein [Myxococcales bacterium]